MAKSLRSKRMRANRKVMREKAYHKEIDRLKRLSAKREEALKQGATCTVKTGAQLRKRKEEANAMEVDQPNKSTGKKYNLKTMKDSKGNFPSWLSKRAKKHLKLERKGIVFGPLYKPKS